MVVLVHLIRYVVHTALFAGSLARSLPVLPGAPKWSRWTQGVPSNWPDRVGEVGRGRLRFAQI